MKNNLLTIGQMAKLNHTTLATLRLYDDKGLLKPKSVNPMNGYRTYDVRQSAVFHMIQHNKDLGLNLNEIKALLDCSDQAFLVDMYHQKLKDLDQQMKYIYGRRNRSGVSLIGRIMSATFRRAASAHWNTSASSMSS